MKTKKPIIRKEDLDPGAYFLNRELSWLAFNARVLEETRNSGHPLLERLGFLSISDSNLDEFYMVRVAAYKSDLTAELSKVSSQQSNADLLKQIAQAAGKLIEAQVRTWRVLRHELKEVGFEILDVSDLSE